MRRRLKRKIVETQSATGGGGGEKNGILLFKEIENLSKGENRKDDKGSFKTNKNKHSIRRREEI